MSQRTERIDELLRQEIGAMLEREVADPRIGFVTVTEVETAPDLRHARVWVSVIGGGAERAETVAALERAMVFVRRELGRRLRIKRIPDLHVRLDDSIERGTRVLKLIDSLESGTPPPEQIEGESLPTPHRGTPGPGRATAESMGAADSAVGEPATDATAADAAGSIAGSGSDGPGVGPEASFGSAAAEYAARVELDRRAARTGRKAGPTKREHARPGAGRGGHRHRRP